MVAERTPTSCPLTSTYYGMIVQWHSHIYSTQTHKEVQDWKGLHGGVLTWHGEALDWIRRGQTTSTNKYKKEKCYTGSPGREVAGLV